MSINWLKPIEPTPKCTYESPEVLRVLEDGSAVVLCKDNGRDYADIWLAENGAWRNVPELSERDKRLLLYALGNPLGGEVRDSPHWFRVHAADLAREFGE